MKTALLISLLSVIQTLSAVHANELCNYGVCANGDISEECKAGISKWIDSDLQSDKSSARHSNLELSQQLLIIRNAAVEDGADASLKVIDSLIYEALYLTMKDKKIKGYGFPSYPKKLKEIQTSFKNIPLNISQQQYKQLEELFKIWEGGHF